MSRGAGGPFAALRVVELSHLIAGPYCGMLLADQGADVIKVEPPGGELSRRRDPLRAVGGETLSAHYASMNRGKRSAVFDLKDPEDHRLFLELLRRSDVFITNLRPSALARMGLDPQRLAEEIPGLVILAISGFGISGASDAELERAGLAVIAEALSGVTGLTRDASNRPIWCGFPLGDIMAALTGYGGVLAALLERRETGKGRVIDVDLPDATLPLMGIAMARQQIADERMARQAGPNDFHGVPYGVFKAKDGYVNIGANTDVFWHRICTAMGRPELGTDPRYATYGERAAHMHEVLKLVEDWTTQLPKAAVADALQQVDVPVAPLSSITELFTMDLFRRRHMLWEVEDGLGGSLLLPGDPTTPSEEPPVTRIPRLGEHTEELKQSLQRTVEKDEV